MITIPRVGLALVLLSGLTAPASPAQATADTSAVAQATVAAQSWLATVDRGDYEASWDQAAPAFQQAVTKADWVKAVSQARGPFEPFGARTLTSATFHASLPNAPPGPYVIIQYQTNVSQNRKVTETIVPMRLPDGSWRTSGYFVKPVS